MINFLLLPLLFSSLPQFEYNYNKQEMMEMISRILPALQFILVLFWSRSLSTNQMEKGNQDKSNDSSYNPGYDQYMSLYLNPEDTHTKFWNTEPPSFSNTTEHLEAEDGSRQSRRH
jgi:hypothetical protein